jgi:tRNA A37 methylthiotransferase MiaB
MRRGYTRESYLELVDHIRSLVPQVTLSSDFICGFCGETDAEFEETITLMEKVQYNWMYVFPYSLREKTHAHRRMEDNVPADVKQHRLERMNLVLRQTTERLNKAQIGSQQLVLVEGVGFCFTSNKKCLQLIGPFVQTSKRSQLDLAGRNDTNLKVIFPDEAIPENFQSQVRKPVKPGDFVVVEVNSIFNLSYSKCDSFFTIFRLQVLIPKV